MSNDKLIMDECGRLLNIILHDFPNEKHITTYLVQSGNTATGNRFLEKRIYGYKYLQTLRKLQVNGIITATKIDSTWGTKHYAGKDDLFFSPAMKEILTEIFEESEENGNEAFNTPYYNQKIPNLYEINVSVPLAYDWISKNGYYSETPSIHFGFDGMTFRIR